MKVNNYLLTIAIPTYNRADFLIRSLNSILSQYDDRVEVLVSDNASGDNTQEVMAGFQEQYQQIKYIRNENNIGPDANFLQCLKLACGEYILLLGDDDLFVENSLKSLLSFLEETNRECSLVFLNHVFFQNGYIDLEHCSKPFLREAYTHTTTAKKELMIMAQHRLTYMSSFLLSRDAFRSVQNPEKFAGTFFMHTCIAFEATKGEDVKFGIVAQPCIAQDSTVGNTPFDVNPQKIFYVFGTCEEHVYCDIAPQFGYGKEYMDEIYTDYICEAWRGAILKTKALDNKAWKTAYKSHVKHIFEKHKKARRKLRLYVHCPAWVAKIVYKTVRPLYRKLKHKKGEI